MQGSENQLGECMTGAARSYLLTVSRQTAADGLVFRRPVLWKQSGGLYLNGASTLHPQSWKPGIVTLTTWWPGRESKLESQQPQFLCHRGCNFWVLSLTRQLCLCPVLITASLLPPPSPACRSCSQALSMPCSAHCAQEGEGAKLQWLFWSLRVVFVPPSSPWGWFSKRCEKSYCLSVAQLEGAVSSQHTGEELWALFYRPHLCVRCDLEE